jgi:glycosyltransferase involved in cell wall biosynthesis
MAGVPVPEMKIETSGGKQGADRSRPADGPESAGPVRRIVLMVRALTVGGAEKQVVTLAKGLSERGHAVTVVVLYGGGELLAELQGSHVAVACPGKGGRWDVAGFFLRLIRLLRRLRPDFILSYINLTNLIASLTGFFLPSTRIVWGLRSGDQILNCQDWLARMAVKAESWASSLPDFVIANSRVGMEAAIRSGFPRERMGIIHNGVDVSGLGRDPEVGRRLRKELEIPADATVIGLVGRINPIKGHPTFLEAAATMLRNRPGTWFLCVGDGEKAYVESMKALAGRLGVAQRVVWPGTRKDMASVYNALDILTNSSYNEGFSNVIIEAMACGVACVVADVGDSASIIGGTGWVVPPRDPIALCEAWTACLSDRRQGLGEARMRIAHLYGKSRLVIETERVLDSLVPPGRSKGTGPGATAGGRAEI